MKPLTLLLNNIAYWFNLVYVNPLSRFEFGSDIEISRIEKLPKIVFDLPRDELYVRLGCATCPKAIRFLAKGVLSSTDPHDSNREDVRVLGQTIDEAGKSTIMQRFYLSADDEPCAEICEFAEEIEVATELINEQFGSNL